MRASMDAGEFSCKTVVILAAGCAEGRDLARMAASAGAHVVVVDHDAEQVKAIAKIAPYRIEALHLDVLRPAHCQLLSTTWAAEPLDLLIHCQALRTPHRAGAAVQAIATLTEGLSKGLTQGRGRVPVLFRPVAPDAGAGPAALMQALEALPPLIQAKSWAEGLSVTGLRLPRTGASVKGLRRVVCGLMAEDTAFAQGVVLPLAPDPIDAGGSGVKPTRDE